MTKIGIAEVVSALRARVAGLSRDDGAGLAEYALLLLFIAMACVVILGTLGTTIANAFNAANGMFNPN